MSARNQSVEISPKTIVFTVSFLLGLWILWMIRDLIFSFIISFIIMSALDPAVTSLELYRIPRAVSALVLFIIIIGFFSYLFSWILPPIVIETSALIGSLPIYFSKFTLYGIAFDVNSLTKYLPDLTGNAFEIVRATFSNIVFAFTTIFFSYYFLLDRDMIRKFLSKFLHHEEEERVSLIFKKAEVRMRDFMWGELTLILAVGVMTYIGLLLVNARYALPLAVLAALLEVIPVIGPIIAAIPAILINTVAGPFQGVTVTAVYFVVQQIENQVLIPLVMKRAVGLNPVVTLAALIVGYDLGGMLGALLAVPISLFIETILIEIVETRKIKHAENTR